MALHLVPIPPDSLGPTHHIWWPFVLLISERDKCDPEVKAEMLRKGEAQGFIIWDSEANKAMAFIGVRFALRGDARIGEIRWLAGENRAAWIHLFGELESYLRDQQGCTAIDAIARPGWTKHLKSNGYRETHRVFEKELVSHA